MTHAQIPCSCSGASQMSSSPSSAAPSAPYFYTQRSVTVLPRLRQNVSSGRLKRHGFIHWTWIPCFIWAIGLMTGTMAFCISGGKQYRQQRAAFEAGLCICRRHCAVNGINWGKIIRCLRLPHFAVRHP